MRWPWRKSEPKTTKTTKAKIEWRDDVLMPRVVDFWGAWDWIDS